MRRTIWAALAAALLVLACGAPAASADSIAYIKDGNVLLSTPDGSRQYQVTTAGGYADVSQADDGTMIALNGVRLHRLDRDGAVLADFDTPVSDTRPAPSKTFYGPFDPAISPDGTKVAYTYYCMTQSQNADLLPAHVRRRRSTRAAPATRSPTARRGWDEPGIGYHSGWRHPSWVDNDMTMLSNPTHLPNRDIILDRISDGGNGHGNMVMNWTQRHGRGQPARQRRRHHARQAQDGLPDGRERHDADRLLRPGLPDRRGRTATRTPARTCTLLPLQRRAGRQPSACRRSRPTARGSPGTTATASTSRPSRPSPRTARSTAPRPTPPLVIPGGREPDWGPADVPARARAAGRHATAARRPGTQPRSSRSRSSARPAAAASKLSRQGRRQGQAQRATAKRGKKVVGTPPRRSRRPAPPR